MSAGVSRDWIELFLEYTEGINSPTIFRKWAAISTVAGALERRVWVVAGGKKLFPNLYVLLVATPGIGKTQAIEHVDQFWRGTEELNVAPHDVTKAALIDRIAKASRRLILGEADLVEYNSLLVAADEFGVLVPAHDTDFLSTLNRIFDNPGVHQQERRGLSQSIDIINPQLNIIGGTQPAYLANLLPEEAWGMGFMSRVIMIHSAVQVKTRIFNGVCLNTDIAHELQSRVHQMLKLYGQMQWTPDAVNVVEKWNESGLEPVPMHSKLAHYNSRRLLHALKLSVISAVSSQSPMVTVIDFNRARDWLLETEQTMPDIFREMVQRSDIQVLDELYFFAWAKWMKDHKSIHSSMLIHFLRNRVPSEKITRILEVAERANIFEKDGDMYRPRPKHEHGLE